MDLHLGTMVITNGNCGHPDNIGAIGEIIEITDSNCIIKLIHHNHPKKIGYNMTFLVSKLDIYTNRSAINFLLKR